MSMNNPGDGAGWFFISIEGVSEGVPYGTLQNHYQAQPTAFRSLDQLFRLAQASMDELDFPQNSVHMRRFTGGGTRAKSRDEALKLRREAESRGSGPHQRRGACAAFEVRVYYRSNASWQGNAVFYHREKRSQIQFRSALELMLAMQDGVEQLDDYIKQRGRERKKPGVPQDKTEAPVA